MVVGTALFAHTFSERYSGTGIGDAYGPLFYPRLLLVAWIVLAGIAFVQAAISQMAASSFAFRWPVGFAMISACALFVGSIFALGFLIASCVFFAATALILGYRNFIVIAVVSLLVPLAIWYLFHVLIEIRLPTSPWFFWM